jgi:hypothetical protein
VSEAAARLQVALAAERATLAELERKVAATTIASFKARWAPSLNASREKVARLERELERALAQPPS